MNRKKNIRPALSRGFILLGYLIFSLVQLNVHFNGAPQTASYFSNGYNLENARSPVASSGHYIIHKAAGKDGKKFSFRLNRRFYPEYFKVSELSVEGFEPYAISYSYPRIEIDPNRDLRRPSYGLRGPPAAV